MLPNPAVVSSPQRATSDKNRPAAERIGSVEQTVRPAPVAADTTVPFSRVAEVERVTATDMDAFVDQLPVGVFVVDRNGRVVYANTAARALRVEHVEPLQWLIMRALLTEDVVREDEIQVAPLGQPRRWLSAHIMPLRIAGLGVNAALVTVSDVTASHQMCSWHPVIESLVNL